MIQYSHIILIAIMVTVSKSILITGNNEILTNKMQCEPSKVYKRDEITCFCNKDGSWPHKNCSISFDNIQPPLCKPNSYVKLDCNICLCSKKGTLDQKLCTKHICSKASQKRIPAFRRSNNNRKCTEKHWYAISSCRICYCVTRNNLLCSAEVESKNVQLGKYTATDCGTGFLDIVNNLISSLTPLRLGNREMHEVKIVSFEPDTKIIPNPTKKKSVTNTTPVSKSVKRDHHRIDEQISFDRNEDDDERLFKLLVDSAENNFGPENEDIATEKAIGRIAAKTVIPFENYEEMDDDNKNEEESDKQEYSVSVEHKFDGIDKIGLREKEINFPAVKKPDIGTKIRNNNNPSAVQDATEKSVIQVNLPQLFQKYFNLGRRMSMVSLNNSNCVPGSTVTVKCNTCFCLNNGKMLCTEKKCY